MRAPRTVLWLWPLVAATLPTSATSQDLTRLERLEIVSSVWSEARHNYPFWERVTADWDSGYRVTLAAAEHLSSPVPFYRSLRQLIALLRSGEADIVPPRRLSRALGQPPLHLIAVEGRPVIARMLRTAETRMAGLQLGSVILEVQGMPVDRWLRDSVLPQVGAATDHAREARAIAEMLVGQRGTAVHLTVRDPDGGRRGLSVTRSMSWPESRVPWWRDDLVVSRDTGTTRLVALATLDERQVVEDFDRVLRDASTPQELVIDLRGTGGTDPAQAYELARRLIGRPVEAPRTKYRIYWPVRRADMAGQTGWTWHLTDPQTIAPSTDPPPYGGRVLLLTSAATAGAAEIFVQSLRQAGRVTVVGERTAGATGPSLAMGIAGGFTLVLGVGGAVDAEANDISGYGVRPDIEVGLTLDGVLAGRDAVLERALEEITQP